MDDELRNHLVVLLFLEAGFLVFLGRDLEASFLAGVFLVDFFLVLLEASYSSSSSSQSSSSKSASSWTTLFFFFCAFLPFAALSSSVSSLFSSAPAFNCLSQIALLALYYSSNFALVSLSLLVHMFPIKVASSVALRVGFLSFISSQISARQRKQGVRGFLRAIESKFFFAIAVIIFFWPRRGTNILCFIEITKLSYQIFNCSLG